MSTSDRIRHPLPATLTLLCLLMMPLSTASGDHPKSFVDSDGEGCSPSEVYPECHPCFIGPPLPGACETPKTDALLGKTDSTRCSPTDVYPECHPCFIGPSLPGACEASEASIPGAPTEDSRSDRQRAREQQKAEKRKQKAERKERREALRNCLSTIQFLEAIPNGREYKVVKTFDLMTWRDFFDPHYSLDDKIRGLTTKACELRGDAILVPPGKEVAEIVVFVDTVAVTEVSADSDTLAAGVKHAE